MSMNKKKINHKISMVYILRGILAGLIISMAMFALAVLIGTMGWGAASYILMGLAITAGCGVLGFLLSFIKKGAVMKDIIKQEKQFGASFDASPVREAGNSGTIFCSDDWLVFHDRMRTDAWYKDNISSIERAGNRSPENKKGLMRVTDLKGRKYAMVYRISGTDLEAELNDWLHPYIQQDDILPDGNVCPNCGTVNEDGALFCANCGTKLL